jgi:hypothetical protein
MSEDINDPDVILRNSMGKMEMCLVLGYKKDTDNFYFAGSTGSKKELIYLCESFKFALLNGDCD